MNGKAFSVIKEGVMNGVAVCIVAGVFFMIVMYTSLAIAQPPRDRHDPDRIMSVLEDRLQLTDEQTEKIRVIFEEQDKKMKSLFEKDRERQRDEMTSMRDQMDTMQKEIEAQLQSVLTEEQMKKYQAFREEEHRRPRNDRSDNGTGGLGRRPYCSDR